jgi:peroxiredoxin
MVLTESNYFILKHGDLAPDFNLMCVDDNLYSFANFKGAKAFLVIFMCNHCPYVKAKFEEIENLTREYSRDGLVVIGINSNDTQAYPDDSFENMKKLAQERKINYTYLVDETQDVAKAYGAACTPDPFLFDSSQRLVYHGRIDNGHGPNAMPTSFELRTAIGQLLSGKRIMVEEHPSMGCNIKWKQN